MCMGYPEGYPDRFKESIFAHSPDSGSSAGSLFSSNSPRDSAGSLVFVFTRGGGRLNVYVFQYMGHIDGRDLPEGETGGDVYDARDHGTINDLHYNPEAEGSFVPEDMHWENERPRLSQPVRDWLRSRDMLLATRENLLRMTASEKGFSLD